MTAALVANFAVVGLLIAIWALSQEWVRSWSRAWRIAGAGLLTGLGSIASMALAVDMFEGFLFDLRGVLLALSGLFGGPLAALLAVLIAGSARLALGGSGAMAGTLLILAYAAIGCVGHYARRHGELSLPVIGAVGLAQSIMPVVHIAMLPDDMRDAAMGTILAPLMLMTGLSSIFAIAAIEGSRHRGWLIHLLKAAISQAPDYFYIKDRHGRIVMANDAAARAAGLKAADDLIGREGFELADPGRVEALLAAERAMLAKGSAITDHEEEVRQSDGATRIYVTTKRAIRNADGGVAGLVGVTKDLTERLALERQFAETRAELDVVLNEMSDGLARFDADLRLVFSNSNYRALFPLTGHLRQPGAMMRDILLAVLDTGEQEVKGSGEEWIDQILRTMREGGEEQTKMYDGRWLLIRSTPLRAGGCVVIVSDISGLKQAESKLMDMAEQMRLLSITDALTGLHNRRDFDAALARHVERALRDGGNLSVVLIDIDRFKAYNDTYGHPAGDACLRQVALAIRDSVKRPMDMAARLGGEEFAVLLPGADLMGAEKVAGDIRRAVEAMQMPHEGAERGYVTISAGLAALDRDGAIATGMELMVAADRALYVAKAGGRNRVVAATGLEDLPHS